MGVRTNISLIITAILLGGNMLVYSQTREVVVKGWVRDTNGRSIAFASIQNEITKAGTSANINGNYIFKTVAPVILDVSLVGYVPQKRSLISNIANTDTIEENFVLQEEPTQLKQVEIRVDHEPQALQEAGNLQDFEVRTKKLWVLYTVRNHSQIRVYDSTGTNLINQLNLKYTADSLNRTVHGLMFTTDHDSTYFYRLSENKFFSFGMPQQKFNASIHDLVEYNNPFYYHIYTYGYGGGVSYWYHSKSDNSSKIFYRYENKNIANDNMRTYGDEDNSAEEGAYMKEMDAEIKASPQAAAKLGNYVVANQRLYRDERRALPTLMLKVNTTLKAVRDSIYVFNFTIDSIDVYDITNFYIRRLPILFDRHDGAYKKREIIVDEGKNTCYFRLEIHGITWLERVDLNTGRTMGPQALKYPYIGKVRIMDGYAYYSYYTHTSGMAYPGELGIYRQRLN